MINLGVDYGTRRIAIACCEQEWAYSYESKKEADRGIELYRLANFYRSKQMQYGIPAHLWIESAIMGISMNVNTTVGMASAQGAVLATHAGPCNVVSVSAWKAALVGHGHATKDDVALWLRDNYVHLWNACESQDEMDAMCLSLYGHGIREGMFDLPAPKKKKRKLKGQNPALAILDEINDFEG